jgi:hypothetical protein
MKTIKILTVIGLLSVSVGVNAQTIHKDGTAFKYTNILASSGDSLLAANQIAKYSDYDFSDILKLDHILAIYLSDALLGRMVFKKQQAVHGRN